MLREPPQHGLPKAACRSCFRRGVAAENYCPPVRGCSPAQAGSCPRRRGRSCKLVESVSLAEHDNGSARGSRSKRDFCTRADLQLRWDCNAPNQGARNRAECPRGVSQVWSGRPQKFHQAPRSEVVVPNPLSEVASSLARALARWGRSRILAETRLRICWDWRSRFAEPRR